MKRDPPPKDLESNDLAVEERGPSAPGGDEPTVLNPATFVRWINAGAPNPGAWKVTYTPGLFAPTRRS